MTFDKKLKALRMENNMTQDYVAKCLNVARSTVAGYETKNRQPSHEKLTAIANLFDVTIDYLVSDSELAELTQSRIRPASSNEEKLLTYYRKLSKRSKEDLITQCQLLLLRDGKDIDEY